MILSQSGSSSWRRIWWLALGIFTVMMCLQGCAGPFSGPPPEEPGASGEVQRETTPAAGPAASLYRKSREALAAGDSERAEMILDRALRIEPANPSYWHAKARLRFQQGDYSQAIDLCRKSNSLARHNPQLKAMNERLIEQARQQM